MKKSFLAIAIFSILLSLASTSLSVYMKFFETTESPEQYVANLGESEIYEMCDSCNPTEQSARWVRIVGKELAENYEGRVGENYYPSCVFQGEILEIEEIMSDFPFHDGVMRLEGFNILFSIDKHHCSDEDFLAGKTQIWMRLSTTDKDKSLVKEVDETHTLYVEFEEEDIEKIGEKGWNQRMLHIVE